MKKIGPGVMGVFEYYDDFIGALKKIKGEGMTVGIVYSPTPHEEIGSLLGMPKLTSVKYYTLAGGILGVISAIALVVYASIQWKFIVGGKPVIPTVPTVIVAFEFLILFAILVTLLGLMLKARLPKFRLPSHYDRRFSDNRFGILVNCEESGSAEAEKILTEAGAEETYAVD